MPKVMLRMLGSRKQRQDSSHAHELLMQLRRAAVVMPEVLSIVPVLLCSHQ
jgi:hypothetical protein